MSVLRKVQQYGVGTEVAIEMMPMHEFHISQLPLNRRLNILVGLPKSWPLMGMIFGRFEPGDLMVTAPLDINWIQLLVQLGFFGSATEALKIWHRRDGGPIDISCGYQTQTIEKTIQLHLWKPQDQE